MIPIATDTADREKRISTLTAVTLLIALFVSHNFWVNARLYPLVPVASWMSVPDWLGNSFYALLLVFLTLLAFSPRQLYRTACIVLILVLVALDQSRMQPFIYMFLATFVFLSLPAKHSQLRIDCLRIMCAFAYIWAGVQKMNGLFYEVTMPWFIGVFIPHDLLVQQPLAAKAVDLMVSMTPSFEALVGILYLTAKNKKIPMAMSATMLVVVLLCLGPLGHQTNAIVWPWNVWLFTLSYWLFSDAGAFPSIFSFRRHPAYAAKVACIFLFGFMPFLALMDRWDGYLSFQLYSGNTHTAYARIDDQDFGKLPKQLQYYVDDGVLNFARTGYGMYEVAPYPEKRIFISVWKNWCRTYGLTTSKLAVVKMGKAEVYDCDGDLTPLQGFLPAQQQGHVPAETQ